MSLIKKEIKEKARIQYESFLKRTNIRKIMDEIECETIDGICQELLNDSIGKTDLDFVIHEKTQHLLLENLYSFLNRLQKDLGNEFNKINCSYLDRFIYDFMDRMQLKMENKLFECVMTDIYLSYIKEEILLSYEEQMKCQDSDISDRCSDNESLWDTESDNDDESDGDDEESYEDDEELDENQEDLDINDNELKCNEESDINDNELKGN